MDAQHHRKQKGIATIEFALTAPMLIILMLAITELGWAFNQYITLIKAVRDGSRYAAANAMSASQGIIALSPDLVSETQELVVYGKPNGNSPLLPGWTTEEVAVTQSGSDYVQVSASYDYTPIITSVIPTYFGSGGTAINFTMQTATVVRAL